MSVLNVVIEAETETQNWVLNSVTLRSWGMKSGIKLRQALLFLQEAQENGKFLTKTEAYTYWKDNFNKN